MLTVAEDLPAVNVTVEPLFDTVRLDLTTNGRRGNPWVSDACISS